MTNNLLKDINDKAMKRLNAIEKGDTTDIELSDSLKGTRLTFLDNGVVCDIPIGSLFSNGLIVNLTTSIPIRFSFIGTVSSNIVTEVKEYGFNNALIEVGVEVDDGRLLVPAHTRHAQHTGIRGRMEEPHHLRRSTLPAYVQFVIPDRDAQRLHLLRETHPVSGIAARPA